MSLVNLRMIEVPLSVALPSTLIMTIVGGLICFFAGARTRAMAPVMAAFAVHVSVGLGNYFASGVTLDALKYHGFAVQYAQVLATGGSTAELPTEFSSGREGWIYVLGVLYFIFGSVPPVGLVFNAMLIGVAVGIIASTSRLAGWPESARIAAWVAVIAPPIVYWPSLLGREASIFLLLSIMALSLSLFIAKRAVLAAATLWGSALLGLVIRPQIALVAMFGILLAAMALAVLEPGRLRVTLLFISPALVALPLGLLRGMGDYLTKFFTGLGNIRTELSMTANSKTGVSLDGFDTPSGVIIGTLRDLPRGILGPLIWEWTPGYWQLAIDASFWAVVVLTCYFAIRWGSYRVRMLSFVLPALSILFLSTAIMGNWGILVRMRTQALPFLLIVMAQGFYLWRRRHLELKRRALPVHPLVQPVALRSGPKDIRE